MFKVFIIILLHIVCVISLTLVPWVVDNILQYSTIISPLSIPILEYGYSRSASINPGCLIMSYSNILLILYHIFIGFVSIKPLGFIIPVIYELCHPLFSLALFDHGILDKVGEILLRPLY